MEAAACTSGVLSTSELAVFPWPSQWTEVEKVCVWRTQEFFRACQDLSPSSASPRRRARSQPYPPPCPFHTNRTHKRSTGSGSPAGGRVCRLDPAPRTVGGHGSRAAAVEDVVAAPPEIENGMTVRSGSSSSSYAPREPKAGTRVDACTPPKESRRLLCCSRHAGDKVQHVSPCVLSVVGCPETLAGRISNPGSKTPHWGQRPSSGRLVLSGGL